jgi:hypothetical protein
MLNIDDKNFIPDSDIPEVQSVPADITAEPQEPENIQQVETAQARNFRQMRERMDRLERERDEALRLAQQRQQEEDLDIEVAPDELAEGKHIAKVQKQIKRLESQLMQNRLYAQYPDFDTIVSKENLEKLSEQHPEISATLQNTKDVYSAAASAYSIIKKLGIAEPTNYQAAREKEAIEKNLQKPRSIASVAPHRGNSPLSQVIDFADMTKDAKMEIFRRTQEAAKRR